MYMELVDWRRRIQNQVTKAAIAQSTTTPPTAPPTMVPVLDFEDVRVGEDVPVSAPDVIEAGNVVDVTAVAVESNLVAVDSGASKSG